MLIITTIMICLLFTVPVIAGAKKNPVSGLHNLPIEIQERVHSLPEYEGKLEGILSTKDKKRAGCGKYCLLGFLDGSKRNVSMSNNFVDSKTHEKNMGKCL